MARKNPGRREYYIYLTAEGRASSIYEGTDGVFLGLVKGGARYTGPYSSMRDARKAATRINREMGRLVLPAPEGEKLMRLRRGRISFEPGRQKNPKDSLAYLLGHFGLTDNGKWKKVPSVTGGGKPYFWFNPSLNGARHWIVWNRAKKAFQWQSEKFRPNPGRRENPGSGRPVKIYSEVHAIYASKAGMRHHCDAACKKARHLYRHKFKTRACIYGLPDGSILIK